MASDSSGSPVSDISQLVGTEELRADAATRLFTPLRAAEREIRLLAIHPGTADQPVQCSLLYTSLLDEHPLPFETVSYCWGDIARRAIIHVEGARLDVAASAAEALRRFRRNSSSRILWLDAVCINQHNLEEKGRQVAFMGEVYHKALRNLIWLGQDDVTTGEALDIIQQLLEHARTETEDFRTLPLTAYDEYGAYVVSTTGLDMTFDPVPPAYIL